jgi:glyoxalase family protein
VALEPAVVTNHPGAFDTATVVLRATDGPSGVVQLRVDGGEREWEARGSKRGGLYAYDEPPAGAGVPGAGTVHHVAWASTMEEHEAWQRRVTEAGMHATPVIDRFWFRSVYFREPSGVLFELATLGPGFGIDEDPAHLGESLILPPAFEYLRDRVERVLTPLPDPRAGWAS